MMWVSLFGFLIIAVGLIVVDGALSDTASWVGSLIAAIGMAVLIMSLVLILIDVASAQEHHGHRPQDQAIHHQFYNSWMMPDNRAVSCCHDSDCEPAQAKRINGQWFARKDSDTGNYTPIPPQKEEHDRDSPDGRSHLCGQRFGFNEGRLTVFCFIAGGGV